MRWRSGCRGGSWRWRILTLEKECVMPLDFAFEQWRGGFVDFLGGDRSLFRFTMSVSFESILALKHSEDDLSRWMVATGLR